MTKKILTYLFLLLLAVSCNEESATKYTINGNANNMVSDILVYGIDGRFQRVDSIIADKKGDFTYSIECDTVVPLIMRMPDGKQITLFAEPNVKAKLTYDCITQKCSITNGGAVQMLHDSISQVIEKCRNKRERTEVIEEFVNAHPISEVNIELLRRYMINIPEPDFVQIKNIISKLGGILQDNEYLALTKKNIDNSNGNTLHKQFPSFTYHTADSCKEITLNTFNKKHLLVTLWASWDNKSRRQMEFLHTIDSIVTSENFDILNIAFDHDTIAWKECVEKDSIIGYNVCEKEAWSSEIASKFNITSLPYSILLNPYQRIIRVNVDLEKDGASIDSLVVKHEISVKEREKREKEKEKAKEKKKKNKKK